MIAALRGDDRDASGKLAKRLTKGRRIDRLRRIRRSIGRRDVVRRSLCRHEVRHSESARLPSKQAPRCPFTLKNIPFHITWPRLSSNDNRYKTRRGNMLADRIEAKWI